MNLWPTPPDPLPSLEGSIHVWAVALNDAQFDARSRPSRLSPEEQARAERFKFAKDRRRYRVAHVALREILAGYLKVATEDLQIVDGQNGKPQLAAGLASSGVEFNLSHSHERALIAVTQGLVVGIDVEFVKNEFGFHDIAEHFFTQREVSALHALPPPLQRQAFYKCWTSKEAFLKAKGTGLSGALDEVEISLTTAHRVAIDASVDGWSLTELNPGDAYEGALVVEGEAMPIQRYRWQTTS
ncbi:MAG: 4'-phosphopantetheinyl transferase family protein [Candidatus Binatia bacterium]